MSPTEPSPSSAVRIDRFFLIAIFLVLAGIHIIVGRLPCAGDETRYAFQGVGLYNGGNFYPNPALWKQFSTYNGCGSGGVLASDREGRPLQTLSPSVAFGAALRFTGLEGARWLNFLVGFVGIALLYFMLKSRFPPRTGAVNAAVLFSVGAVALSLPLLPYLQLIYPEVLLFTTATAALYALLLRQNYWALAAIVLLPFIHLRVLPLALAFFVLLIFQMARDGSPTRMWWSVCILYATGLGAFIVSQYWLFGSLTGSAFPAYAPALTLSLERIGMQFYDVRHGAIAYAPLLLVGFAGLLTGVLRRERLCCYSLILFVVYFATFMWSTAQESWMGRFWVAGLPFIAVGIGYWLYRGSRWWEWLPAVPLVMLTFMNSAIFIVNPLWYLESRQSSIAYATLFLVTHVHFGLLLPVDADPGGIDPYTQPIGALLAFTALVVTLLVLCRLPRRARVRASICALAIALLFVPLVSALAGTVSKGTYAVAIEPKRHRFILRLYGHNRSIDAVQFDDQIPAYWTAPPYPSYFTVRCAKNGAVIAESTEPAHPLLVLRSCVDPDEIDIFGTPNGGSDSVYRNIGAIRLIERYRSL